MSTSLLFWLTFGFGVGWALSRKLSRKYPGKDPVSGDLRGPMEDKTTTPDGKELNDRIDQIVKAARDAEANRTITIAFHHDFPRPK